MDGVIALGRWHRFILVEIFGPLGVAEMAKPLVFVDLFAGCGGLSLGLLNSGWKGLFAIEQSADAFKTLRHNLIDDKGGHSSKRPRFNWPQWLDIKPHEIRSFINSHESELRALSRKIDLVAGGPPCQGFSFAGRRNNRDPRNQLFKYHLKLVQLVKPKLVFLENVQGIDIAFGTKSRGSKGKVQSRKSYAARIKDSLEAQGYKVQQELVRAVDYGVPQFRPRYFTVGIRKDIFRAHPELKFFDVLRETRSRFLNSRDLPADRPVTVEEAISDLQLAGANISECNDAESRPGFEQIVYKQPITPYQKLMHGDMNGQAPNSLRLARHRPETIGRFKEIHETCRKGVSLSKADRARLGIKKTSTTPLAPDQPSHTLTTLPDDLLHYSEPRIHTVREHARLQSFPDWFEFHGKYTTGGARRTQECPRYTQVGNAVPPLLAEATGEALTKLLERSRISSKSAKSPRKKRGG